MSIDIDENYVLLKGQGHGVKGQGQIHDLLKKSCNNSCNIGRILTKLGIRVDIDKNYLLVKGQGHRVKGQGQIFGFMKNCLC